MRFRFFSDVAERMMLYRFPDLQFDDDNCVELEHARADGRRQRAGSRQEPDPPKPHSSTGVDGFQDLAAYGSRSRAELMPGYVPPTETPFFGVKRRSTRGPTAVKPLPELFPAPAT